jgi:hypothetical protein
MLRVTNCGIMLVFLASMACQKSAQEERTEAVEAQQKADKTAQEAANERGKEVAKANQEANKQIGEARQEAHEDSLKAVQNEIEKTSGAQANANQEAKEAVDATNKQRIDLKSTVESRLEKIEKRSRDLHKKIDTATPAKVPSDARSGLSDADRQAASVRTELQHLDSAPNQPLTDVKTRLDKTLDGIEKTLDRVDHKL